MSEHYTYRVVVMSTDSDGMATDVLYVVGLVKELADANRICQELEAGELKFTDKVAEIISTTTGRLMSRVG